MASKSTTALLSTGLNELVKQHIVYDAGGRMIATYEARTDANHGDGALLTTFTYVGTTTRVDFMKEQESTWDSSWG